jgi:putative intracellular protease/amidase
VETLALTPGPVRSMGGLAVQPSRVLADLDPGDVALLLLPGGDRWEREPLEPVLGATLGTLDDAGVPLAAICGATIAIARAGLIRGRRHTSNGLDYLRQHVPAYADAELYVDQPAVRDRGLITASGLSDVEFAREIMAELGVLTAPERELWARLFRAGRLPSGAA